jgi:hypothetical protein
MARMHWVLLILGTVASFGLATYLLVTPPTDLVLRCTTLERPEPGVWLLCHQQEASR